MFKDESGEIVPAIVSEELWEQANTVLRRRSEDVKSRQGICNHGNLMTGKLFCTCCGAPYYRKESHDRRSRVNNRWVCSEKLKNGADTCPSFAIYEEELLPLLFEVLQDTKANADAMVEEYIRMYNEMTNHNQLPAQIEAQKKLIDNASKKKMKLLQLNLDGKITDDDFAAMTAQCNAEIDAAQGQINELNEQLVSSDKLKQRIDEIRKTLIEAQKDAAQGVIKRPFIEKYIDRIFVTPEEDGTMRLDIRIFTGETTRKTMEKFKRRTGHTFLTMYPPT